MTDTKRVYYLDNLKVFLIMLVVLHHVGQAYGPTGGRWFYSFPGERYWPLAYLFVFNASFFMGLFFFVSGYFFPASFDRHGPRRFVIDKLIRLGIPIVFGGFIMIPLLIYLWYVHYTGPIGFTDFYLRHWLGWGVDAAHREFTFAHLWFVEHLLVYAVLYAAIQTWLRAFPRAGRPAAAPRVKLYAIVLFIVALGAATYIVRTSWGFHMNRWVPLLGFIQMEPAHLPQYLPLFILGVLARRWSLLESITAGRDVLWLAPAFGVLVAAIATPRPLYPGSFWEFREALLCVGACIGFLALFRTLFNRTGRVMQVLSDNVYGVYILHVPVVVTLQYAFDPVRSGAFTLFAIVSALSLPGAFLASFLVRLIPGVKRVV